MHPFVCSALLVTARIAAGVGPDPVPPPVENTFHLERDASRSRSLKIEVAAGDVRVRAHRSHQVVLDAARSMGGKSCRAELATKGDAWLLQARDPAGKPCVIDVQLRVPPNLAVSIKNGSGNVFVSGLREQLTLDLGQGNAVVGGTFAKFTARLAEGSLSVQGLAGKADIDVAHGNVQAYVAGDLADAKAELHLQVGRGNATVISPFKAARLDVATPAGQSQSQLDTAMGDAKLEVTGTISQGNFVARRGG